MNLMENPPAVLPKHLAEVQEGEPVVLGDLKIIPFAIPGHTPGSMAYILAVKTTAEHTWPGFTGAPCLTPEIVSDEGLATCLKSVRHYKDEAGKANYQKFVDVMEACTEVNIARHR